MAVPAQREQAVQPLLVSIGALLSENLLPGMQISLKEERTGQKFHLADTTSKHFSPLPAKSCFARCNPAPPHPQVLGRFGVLCASPSALPGVSPWQSSF